MGYIAVFCLSFVCICAGQEYTTSFVPEGPEERAAISDMVMAFVVFRHGDRTPDQEELDKYPLSNLGSSIFFPYGKKALTNKGKRRAFRVGQYLRRRYDNLISKLYLPEEIYIQTTDFARTKMTALSAVAALYPPPTIQQWLPHFNWQPIPYDTAQRNDDSLLHFNNCPRYLRLKDELYNLPEIERYLYSSQDLFRTLSKNSGSNITVPEDVFFLDNLFQTLNNVNVPTPKWAEQIMPKIKEMTKVEYMLMYYTDELIRLSAGKILLFELRAASLIQKDNQIICRFKYLTANFQGQ